MKGEDLYRILEKNSFLLCSDIKYTIAYLLKERRINPSVLIDTQVDILENEKDRYKCHFIEADTCNHLFMEGNKEQKEFAKKRAIYNGQFNTCFPKKHNFTDEELKERKEYFELMYGFNPEES